MNSERVMAAVQEHPIRIVLHERSIEQGDCWIVVAGPYFFSNGWEWHHQPPKVEKAVYGFSFAEEAFDAIKKWQSTLQ